MVKSIKHIITRVIIGVLIALILMYLKGGLIADVSALEGSIGDGSSTYDCTNNTVCDIDLGESFKGWDKGYLQFNVSIYDFTWTSNSAYPSIQLGNVYVTVGSTNISCEHTGSSGPRDWQSSTGSGNPYFPNYSYSVKCYVNPKTSGINSLHLRALGYIGGNMNYRVWTPITYHTSDSSDITNSIDENTDAQNETNDTLKSEDAPDTEGLFSDIDTDDSNSPVSDLITMPITLLQALNNNSSGSCTTWNLGTLLGKNLTMPCINVKNIVGADLYNIIDMAICLFLAYNLGLMCITIYNNLTSLNDDFDSMYAPKHEEHGKHGRVE